MAQDDLPTQAYDKDNIEEALLLLDEAFQKINLQLLIQGKALNTAETVAVAVGFAGLTIRGLKEKKDSQAAKDLIEKVGRELFDVALGANP